MQPESYPPMVLTVRQPWAAAIIWGGKTIENRPWRTEYRGRLLIHAAGSRTNVWWNAKPQAEVIAEIPLDLRIIQGMIIGEVTLVDCLPDSNSFWAKGRTNRWRWLLADPKPWAEPVPARGRLRLWPYTGPLPGGES